MSLPRELAGLLPPKRYSVSFLGSAGECLLKARMQRESDAANRFATVGSAAHEVFGTLELSAQFSGRSQVTDDEAETVAKKVMGNPEENVALSYGTFMQVIGQARRFANDVVFPIDADRWVIEHPFRHPLVDPEDGTVYTISGRMDEVAIWGRHYRNRDWKTGPGLPNQQRVEEEHTQLPIYAWAAWREWGWLDSFECEEYYTRYSTPRSVLLTLNDIALIEDYLLVKCRRIKAAYERGQFTPTPGRWCNSMCPAPERCPLPEQAKGEGVHVRSHDDAVEQVEAWLVEEARVKNRKEGVKAYLEGQDVPHIQIGRKGFGFFEVTSSRLNKPRTAEAVQTGGRTLEEMYDTDTETQFTSRVL